MGPRAPPRVLSNLHLGARDPETGGLVMLGKTFKGLTDEMLAWQTSRLLDLADPPARTARRETAATPTGSSGSAPNWSWRSRSTGSRPAARYPGGLALRFARVLRYRPDKTRPRRTPSTRSAPCGRRSLPGRQSPGEATAIRARCGD